MNRYVHLLSLAALVALSIAAGAQRAAAAELTIPDPILLWPDGAPGATGTSDEDKPAVWVFLPPAEKATGAAILVCPGGAFTTRCTDQEGVLPARWLNDHGIAAFVLRYRIRPLYQGNAPDQDANRAMQYIRANAEKYKIATDRIGIMGFSAGGELCTRVAWRPVAAKPDSQDPLDRVASNANFLIPIYGASGPGTLNRATAPPTFLFCTLEDSSHMSGTLNAYAACVRAQVPVEAHLYQSGEHGTSFAIGDPVLGTFKDMLYNWLDRGGLLTGKPGAKPTSPATADAKIPEPTLLWPNGAPGAKGDTDADKPAIWAFLPTAEKATAAGILICPSVASASCPDREGAAPARWLNDHGIAAFVLRYRSSDDGSVANQDAIRAMQTIRASAEKYHISSDRIGILGFGAGGELASRVGWNPLAAKSESEDTVERVSSKADFLVLNGAAPLSTRSASPPTFLFGTMEDTTRMTAVVAAYRALPSVEGHFFQGGEPGAGFSLGEADLMYNWLRQRGLLTTAPRIAIRGIAKLDGAPLIRGIVILTPLDGPPGAPPVTCYVMNATAGAPIGLFQANQALGPTAGKYRVEVRQDATRWLSNANTPRLTGQAQMDYIRNRNLSPSIENQRVYRTKHPGDKDDMIVEIKAGAGNFDIEVFSK